LYILAALEVKYVDPTRIEHIKNAIAFVTFYYWLWIFK